MSKNIPEEEIKKSYFAVIPANVRYCEKIADGAKLLYGEISALANEKGYCWASNEYFAELYNVKKLTISRWISSLVAENFIYTDQTSGRRKIFIAQHLQPAEAAAAPGPEKEAAPAEKEKPKKEKIVKFTQEDRALAELLLSKILYNFPHFENKKVKLDEWAEDIRKLREIDKATPEQIRFMIMWVHGGEAHIAGRPPRTFEPHTFWAKNIMSAAKLRKQWFDNLVPQLQESARKQAKKTVQL